MGLGLGLKRRIARMFGLRQPWEFRVASEAVETAIRRAGVQPWLAATYTHHQNHWNAWQPSLWLARRLPKSARILETACGSAANLVWFGERGYRDLSGFDLAAGNLAAAREIGQAAGVSLTLWEDDGISPRRLDGPYDAILAINWIYVAVIDERFDLAGFLAIYASHLRPGGYFALDVVDPSFDAVPLGCWHSQDWEKPEPERRSSEYRWRHSMGDVAAAAAPWEMRIVATFDRPKGVRVPNRVYVLRRDSIGL